MGKPQVCAVIVAEDGSALTGKAVEEAVAAEVGETDPRLQRTGGVWLGVGVGWARPKNFRVGLGWA